MGAEDAGSTAPGLDPTPSFGRLEVAAIALVSAALSTVMSWPLVLHLSRQIPADTGDPLAQAWQVAWGGHALLHQPLHFFQSNSFWPLHNSLAFSDALIGYAPAGLIGSGTVDALIRYDLLYLFAYALAFAGAYLLAREMGVGQLAATVAGAAFAFAPWRLSQNGHLHVLSSGGIPLALFLLVRGHRRRSPRMVFTGWIVAAWEVSIGFTLGLQLAYLLGILMVLAVIRWVVRGRPAPDRSVLVASLAGVILFGAWAGLQARPYLAVLREHPEAKRPAAEVAFYSPPLKGLLSAPEDSILWGAATKRFRDGLPWAPEQTIFPGLLILLLAIGGLSVRSYPRTVRVWLLIGVLLSGALALGYRLANGTYTYSLLYDHAPGWQSSRTPGRLMTMTSLGLGLLGALGASFLAQAARRAARGDVARRIAEVAVGVILAGVVLLEGAGHVPHPDVPTIPPGQIGVAGPQLHLPPDDISDETYMYWSVDGFPDIVNGTSGFVPTFLSDLRQKVASFPDAQSVAYLRSIGVRTVILHPDRVAGTPWQDAPGKSITGLGITRRDADGVVVFDLSP